MRSEGSAKQKLRAEAVLVGGVNSPVRAFGAAGGEPFWAESGRGAMLRTSCGRELIDYVLSWGPLIIGHAHPTVTEAVCRAMRRGASFGVTCESEVLLAERIILHIPGIEKLRFVNSGTEAAMSAIRLARGVTGRDLVVKAEGGYHGHADGLLAEAGSGPATLGEPSSAGVPQAYAQCTLTVPFNDLGAARGAFAARGPGIACVIVEPVAGNMGVIPPEPGYLEGLRSLTREHGALLIFDEVMTGFRVAMGGAQERYGVAPDLTILGKIIGGGLPVGAYGGPAPLMDHLAPLGPVYQAGTLSGNPLAMAAGLATLEVLEEPGMIEGAEAALTALQEGIGEIASGAGVPIFQTQAGAMGSLFFHEGPVRNFAEAQACHGGRYAAFFRGMAERGFFFAPSPFEACFTSTLHDGQIIERTLDAARTVIPGLR